MTAYIKCLLIILATLCAFALGMTGLYQLMHYVEGRFGFGWALVSFFVICAAISAWPISRSKPRGCGIGGGR